MKVLQIANDYLNPLFAKMFHAMQIKGIDNKVVVPIKYGGTIDKNWDKDVMVLECFRGIDRLLYFRKQRKVRKAIESNLNIRDYDIIHAHTLFSAGYTAMKLSEKYSVPYVVAVRNTDVNIFFRYMPHLRKTGVRILKKAEAIIFLSSAYRDIVINSYVPRGIQNHVAEKSYVIPNGISNAFFLNIGQPKHYTSKQELVLLYVGEITLNKNIETIVKVARIRNKMGVKTRVVIVGSIVDYQCESYLKDPLVEYHERCNQDQLIEYYRSADVFVMPSHTETFGLVYVESMSQGLPILYTRGQGFDGYFEDGVVGYAVDDNNAHDICKKIEYILSDYTRISSNCIKECHRFSWDKIASEYKQLYAKCNFNGLT